MNLHSIDVAARLRRYLNRRQMPRFLDGKPEAIRAEIDAMTAAVARHAPHGDKLTAWWPEFEARLAAENKTRSWPSEGEIKAAATAGAAASMARLEPTGDDLALIIAEKRFERGEAVGEECLFGSFAIALLRRGSVTTDDVRKYRSALYFSSKSLYGEVKAKAMEDARLKIHEDAMSVENGPSAPHPRPFDNRQWSDASGGPDEVFA